jgi:hypothetical protein
MNSIKWADFISNNFLAGFYCNSQFHVKKKYRNMGVDNICFYVKLSCKKNSKGES